MPCNHNTSERPDFANLTVPYKCWDLHQPKGSLHMYVYMAYNPRHAWYSLACEHIQPLARYRPTLSWGAIYCTCSCMLSHHTRSYMGHKSTIAYVVIPGKACSTRQVTAYISRWRLYESFSAWMSVWQAALSQSWHPTQDCTIWIKIPLHNAIKLQDEYARASHSKQSSAVR